MCDILAARSFGKQRKAGAEVFLRLSRRPKVLDDDGRYGATSHTHTHEYAQLSNA